MAPEYSFSFTDTAADDLNETLLYIGETLGDPAAAAAFLQKTEDALRVVRTFPLSGAPVENPFVRRNDIRKTPVGNYVLYYLPDHLKREIVVLRIVYGPCDRDRIERKL